MVSRLRVLTGQSFLLLSVASACLFPTSTPAAEGAKAPAQPGRPKLVIGLVIDQMRWDFLHRYSQNYGENGFKRLLRQGFSCEDTQINYLPTYTGSGHASIYTGSVPAIHGITGNNFIIQDKGQPMYCVEDKDIATVGSTSGAGRMSPKNLLTTTIGDELRLATNFRSKVVGISLKDRGAILAAGHSATAAYWYDGSGPGQWITSTYYRETLPKWVEAFNAQFTAASYLKDDWHRLLPEARYGQSEADANNNETPLNPSGSVTLPIPTSTMRDQGELLRLTPFGNTMTLDFARQAIVAEGLGTDDFTDLLAISLSSTDYIGHQFGPNSVEIEDTYLRLDADIAKFLTDLDATVGEGNYLLFLTADHGVAHNANFLRAHHLPAGIWPGDLLLRSLNAALETEFKIPKPALKIENSQVSLDRSLIRTSSLDEKAVARFAARFLQGKTGVADAFLTTEAVAQPLPELLRQRVINGYNSARSGQVQIILKPGWYDYASHTGTTHGSWSPYDSHIPLVWFGAGIAAGELYRQTHITDIAPTLAALLKIQSPNGSVGEIIPEVLTARPPLKQQRK